MEVTLGKLITEFSMGNTELDGYIPTKEQFIELLNKYFNDKNSSTLREEVMCYISGKTPNTDKLGYDCLDSNDEMKPKNHDTTNPKSKKLDGGGNYSDMTHKRHEKFNNDNVVIHVGGFVDGKLIYQFKVPYSGLSEKFNEQLNKKFPNGDIESQYLRSMTFSLSSLKECKDVTIEYMSEDINNYTSCMTGTLHKYLMTLKQNG